MQGGQGEENAIYKVTPSLYDVVEVWYPWNWILTINIGFQIFKDSDFKIQLNFKPEKREGKSKIDG